MKALNHCATLGIRVAIVLASVVTMEAAQAQASASGAQSPQAEQSTQPQPDPIITTSVEAEAIAEEQNTLATSSEAAILSEAIPSEPTLSNNPLESVLLQLDSAIDPIPGQNLVDSLLINVSDLVPGNNLGDDNPGDDNPVNNSSINNNSINNNSINNNPSNDNLTARSSLNNSGGDNPGNDNSSINNNPVHDNLAAQSPLDNPVNNNPANNNSVSDNSVSNNPVSDNPVSDNSVSDNSISDNPVSNNSVSDNPVNNKPVSDNSVSDNSVSDNPVNNKPVNDNPVSDSSFSNNSVSDNSVSDNSVSDNSVSDNSVSGNSVGDNSVSDNPVNNKPVSDNPANDDPVDDNLTVQVPSTEFSPASSEQTSPVDLEAETLQVPDSSTSDSSTSDSSIPDSSAVSSSAVSDTTPTLESQHSRTNPILEAQGSEDVAMPEFPVPEFPASVSEEQQDILALDSPEPLLSQNPEALEAADDNPLLNSPAQADPAIDPIDPNQLPSEFPGSLPPGSSLDSLPVQRLSTVEALVQLQAHPNPLRLPLAPEAVEIDQIQALTLAAAIELAHQNNTDLQVRQLQLEQQWAVLRQQQSQNYPTLTWSSNLERTRTDTAVEVNSGTISSVSQGGSNTGTTGIDSTVRLDYNIFDPDRQPTIRAAERQVRQAELLLEQQIEQLRLDVTSAYYTLQQTDEQVRISQQAVLAAERSLQDAQALERAGVGTRFAVLQAEVQLANEQQNLVNNQANQSQARRALVQILNLPSQVEVVAADPVEKAGDWELSLPDSIILAFENRPELEQRLVEREISEAQQSAARAGTRPTFSFFGQYTVDRSFTGTFRNQTFGGDNNQESLSNQYQFGLNLQWPIFDGWASRASAKQQEIGKEIAEVQFAGDRNRIRREVEDAYYDINANLQNITTAERGVDQANEALRLARLRFQAGVGTQIDVLNAERDLTQAEGNLVTAIIGYNQALVQMQRAVSNFPDLETETP